MKYEIPELVEAANWLVNLFTDEVYPTIYYIPDYIAILFLQPTSEGDLWLEFYSTDNVVTLFRRDKNGDFDEDIELMWDELKELDLTPTNIKEYFLSKEKE